MKEGKDLLAKNGGTNLFKAQTKGVKAGTALAIYAGISGAMIAGYEGDITDIDYMVTEGIRTPNLVNDQVISVDGVDYIIQHAIQKDDKGKDVIGADGKPVYNKPKAPTILFADGRKMTLGLLLQGGVKTTIHFKGDAEPTASVNFSLGLAEQLIGKRLKCTAYFTDASNPVNRNDNVTGQLVSSRPRNCYEFIETTPDAA